MPRLPEREAESGDFSAGTIGKDYRRSRRAMINCIEIHVGAERGKPDVILVGALAQILALTQQNKTAASIESDGRVLMVAGVGFEPTTFRL